MDGLSGVVRWMGAGLDAAPLALLQAPAIKRLPGAPLHERLLLENPWPVVLVCGLVGVVALMVLRSRGRVRAGLAAAAGALVVAGAIVGLASVVETDRENMRARSLELVDAVAAADMVALDRLLADDVLAEDPQGLRELDKGAIESRVAARFGPQGSTPIKEHRVQEVEAAVDGPRVGRTQVRTTVVLSELGVPIGSWWRVDWRRDDPEGWRVVGVTPIWVQGLRTVR